jgi:predicted translin family RNA/ssDNA-binding protein
MILDIDVDENTTYAKAAACGREKLVEVQRIYAGLKHEVEGDLFWRHHRQISPGLQEYIEALSFAYYLEHKALISFDDVQKSLCEPEGRREPVCGSYYLTLSCPCLKRDSHVQFFPLTPNDYLLGVSDLTGELMRFAISAMSRRGGRSKAQEVCIFLRNCSAGKLIAHHKLGRYQSPALP